MTSTGARSEPIAHLPDCNVLVALSDAAHVHHESAVRWFLSSNAPFATCPITQGNLVRMLLLFGAASDATVAMNFLSALTSHQRHRFWPDSLTYPAVSWKGVLGQRQVTDAYLASLARHHAGRLVTFDRGLAALHLDIADLLLP